MRVTGFILEKSAPGAGAGGDQAPVIRKKVSIPQLEEKMKELWEEVKKRLTYCTDIHLSAQGNNAVRRTCALR